MYILLKVHYFSKNIFNYCPIMSVFGLYYVYFTFLLLYNKIKVVLMNGSEKAVVPNFKE